LAACSEPAATNPRTAHHVRIHLLHLLEFDVHVRGACDEIIDTTSGTDFACRISGGNPMNRIASITAALMFIGFVTPVTADGDGRRGHRGGERKEVFWDGNCKVERKWGHDGRYKEERKCQGPSQGPTVVHQPAVVHQPGVVIQPPAIVIQPPGVVIPPPPLPVRVR
jgi:hypothetical protein